jgi:hypothetical protein
MKHVGKMKNNNAKVAVVYRTLPGDSGSALVVGTGTLPESWHDSLMNLIQDVSGQQANDLADILSVRKFPDGSLMLEALHGRGHLKKVPTNGVIMTPAAGATVLLSELNQLIAEQKGVTLDQLAITDGIHPNRKTPPVVKDDPTRTTSQSVSGDDLEEVAVVTPKSAPAVVAVVEESTDDLSPAQLRSKADALFKQAQVLRKQADTIDPPKSKKKSVTVDA